MLFFLFSLLLEFVIQPDLADFLAFKNFKKSGTEAVCLIDYQNKTVECNYKDMTECRNEYGKGRHMVLCMPRKSLKLGDN